MTLRTPLTLITLLYACFLYAQEQAIPQDSQEDIRYNPEIENAPAASGISYPSYVKVKSNHINLNGDDWSELADVMCAANAQRVNIVHIGDSHLQADIGTAVTRNRLGQRLGTAGRALVVPFRLAGTNEPFDYSIQSSVSMRNSRLLKTPWATKMGFTGISLEPQREYFDFVFSSQDPFDSVEILYSGDDLELADNDSLFAISEPGCLKVVLANLTTSASLKFHAQKGTAIHGFILLKGNSGIAYNVIGNNGATYGTYNALDGFATDISKFHPALIIISLGTNEAFGKTSNEELRRQITTMIGKLRNSCPEAKFLLTTPAECQRKIVTRRRRKGRRRRRVTSYLVNANISRLRQVIVDLGRDEGIPVYDFYEVAGGSGSSFKWLSDHYLNKDRIHLTHAGYTLQGNLFTDALEEAIGITEKNAPTDND